MATITDQTLAPAATRPKRRRRLDAVAVISLAWIAIVLAAALLGNILTRYGATVAADGRLLSPSTAHLLGTDSFSRDVLDRIIIGARSSIIIGFAVAVGSSLLGGAVGIAAAMWRPLDNLLMRILDALIAFPSILMAIMLVILFGQGEAQVVVALTVVFFPLIARVIRGITLSVASSQYVEAAQVIGAGRVWATRHHVLPNVLGPLGVQGTYVMSRAIVIDAALSFLGLGVPPPAPTWGNMLGDARLYIGQAWWMMVAPGLCIVLTALAVNFAGDWLRDLTDKTGEAAR